MEKRIYKINVRDGAHLSMARSEAIVEEYGPYKVGLYIEHGYLTTVLWAQCIELMVTKTSPITGPWLVGYGWAGDCVIPTLSGNKLPHFSDVGEITVEDESPLFPTRVVAGNAPDDAVNKVVEMRHDHILGHWVFDVLTSRVGQGSVVDRRGLMDVIMPEFDGEGVTPDRRWYIRRTPSMSVALGTTVDRVVAKWL